jgi:ribosomal protein L11 methyltransferase
MQPSFMAAAATQKMLPSCLPIKMLMVDLLAVHLSKQKILPPLSNLSKTKHYIIITNELYYIQVTAVVTPTQPWSDLLIAELAEIGFESFEENLKGFKAYIPVEDFDEEKLKTIALPEGGDEEVSFSFSVETINSRNWNNEWESNFEPVDVDGKCFIRAPFHEEKPNYEYQILIEPKMSFGTGHHETTTLMVQWMLETDFDKKSVLDMGCGTGILAILAAIKGANPVLAIDNFPYAYENTVENIEKNNVTHIRAMLGDASLLGDEKFDVILANITKNVLKEDLARFVDVLQDGGFLFISGFFHEDMDELVALASKKGLSKSGHKQNKEWVAVKFQK